MREIKFRGKSGTQWRYGDLYHDDHGKLMIYEPQTKGRTLEGSPVFAWRVKVEPETVGQYTGLRDSKRREIYEGDILHITAKNPYRSPFDHKSSVKWGNGGWECFGETLYNLLMRYSVLVIGNIHDNPELLEDSNGRL